MMPKELAELFGMSLNDFMDFTGYSYQTLNRILKNKSKTNNKRFKAVINQLKHKASFDLAKDREIAFDKYNLKMIAIDNMENGEIDLEEILDLYRMANI